MGEYKGTYTSMADAFRTCLAKTNGVTANTDPAYKQKLRAPMGVIEPVEQVIEGNGMFEQTLQEMTATITLESGMFQTITASNVGVSPAVVFCGSRRYTFEEAVAAIEALDVALRSCSKYLYKRIRATRMQFVCAFGPEMMEHAGAPPQGKEAY